MAFDLATVVSLVSVGTSVGSMAVAAAALRRSSPRLRVEPDDFAYRASPVTGGRLTVDVHVTNSGDKPARIAAAYLVALAPLPPGSVPQKLTETLPGGFLVMPGRRAAAAPLGSSRPVRLLIRRSTHWQQFRAPLPLPDDESATKVEPFDGVTFTATAPWSAAKKAHWLRFEVHLVTGAVLYSPWWRNWRDVIESYETQDAGRRSLIRSAERLRVALRPRPRRDPTPDTEPR